jgi:hypothetical protein
MDTKHKNIISQMIVLYSAEEIARAIEIGYRCNSADGSNRAIKDKCAAVIFSNAAYEAAEQSV